MKLKARFSLGIFGLISMMGVSTLAVTPAQASAEAFPSTPTVVTSAAACGYTGNSGTNAGNLNAYYNHCGTGNVRVQIDYQVGNDFRCVSPGVTWIRYQIWNPVTNIFAVGGC